MLFVGATLALQTGHPLPDVAQTARQNLVQRVFIMASTTFSGPVTSTAGFVSGSDSLVSIAADTTLTAASHAGRTMNLNVASGATVTLPAASGSGNTYRFFMVLSIAGVLISLSFYTCLEVDGWIISFYMLRGRWMDRGVDRCITKNYIHLI